MKTHENKFMKGFSLIELSMVILVMSVLISGTVIFVGDASFQAKLIDDEERINIIDDAVKKFFFQNGRLPCPAARNSDVNTANFGVETDCTLSSAPSGTVHSGGARLGVIPVRTLGLDENFMFDAYNNRFTYAAVRSHATTAESFNIPLTSEQMFINHYDGSTFTPITNISGDDSVLYVLIGHGPDGRGATNYSGSQNDCFLGTLDYSNCATDNNFIDVVKNPENYNNNIRWSTKQQLKYSKLEENDLIGLNKSTGNKFGLFSYYSPSTSGSSNLASVSGDNKMPFNKTFYNKLSDGYLDEASDEVVLGPGNYIMRVYTNVSNVGRSAVRIESSISNQRVIGIATQAVASFFGDTSYNYAAGYMKLDEVERISVIQYTENASSRGLARANNNNNNRGQHFIYLEIWEL